MDINSKGNGKMKMIENNHDKNGGMSKKNCISRCPVAPNANNYKMSSRKGNNKGKVGCNARMRARR